MKHVLPVTLALSALACQTSTTGVEWVDYGDDPMANPQYMEDMTAAGTPGAEHELLVNRTGTWKVEGQIWLEPGSDPMPMNATAKSEVLFGGRYVIEEFESDFMGMPFHGRLLQGFDNLSQEYWSIWIDNHSTVYGMSRGTETSPGHLEFRGEAKDILTPGGRTNRMTVSDDGNGGYIMRMFDSRDGVEEFQTMELHYTRG